MSFENFNTESKTRAKNKPVNLLKKYLLRVFIAHIILFLSIWLLCYIIDLRVWGTPMSLFILLSIFIIPFYLFTPIYAIYIIYKQKFKNYEQKPSKYKKLLLPGSIASMTIFLPFFLISSNVCTGSINTGIKCNMFMGFIFEFYVGTWEILTIIAPIHFLVGLVAIIIFLIRLIQNIITFAEETYTKNP